MNRVEGNGDLYGLEQILSPLFVDSAVVNGTYEMQHKAANGLPMDEKGGFNHVFERSHNTWLCIHSQRTMLQEDGPRKKKKSNADEPSMAKEVHAAPEYFLTT